MEAVGNCLHRRPKRRPTMAQLAVHLEHALERQLGSVLSINGDDTVVGQNSPPQLNRSFESYEFQFAPSTEESIISLPREGEVNNAKINRKPMWGRRWVSLRNILKLSKKTDLTLPTARLFGEWKHPIRMFSLKDIKLATNDFSYESIIGMGAFGIVYKGFINDGTKSVAIKRFHSYTLTIAEAEVELLATTHYVHLVPFVGLCNENNEMIVVYEYMSRGSLKDHLYGNNQTSLSWELRLKICIGAARGLNYLHEIGFIHRFVKDENIMFNEENFVAKISNFGLSKRLGDLETHVSTKVVGSDAYIDPSYLVTGRLTQASDVYSFGIVLLVVLSGMPAYDSSYPETKYRYVKDRYEKWYKIGNFEELMDPKLVGGIPSASLGKFVHLIKRCLHENPKRRPVMAQVVVNLEESMDLLGIDNGRKEREAQLAFSEQGSQLRDTSTTETAPEQIARQAVFL